MRTAFERRDEIIDKVRALRYLEVEPNIPDAFRLTAIEIRTPTVNDQITRLVGNLTTNPSQFMVPAPKPGPLGQERASRLEKGCTALWDRLEDESGSHLRYRFVDKQVETGEGVYKILYEPHRWDKHPRRDKDESDEDYSERVDNFKRTSRLPIVARVIDRRTYYPWKDEDGLAKVVELTKRRMDDVLADFDSDTVRWRLKAIGLPTPDDTWYTPGRPVTLIEYWDRKYAVYLLLDGMGTESGAQDSAVLRVIEHGYPRLPYFSGYGEETGSDDPCYEGMSAAFAILYLAPFLDSLYTMWANIGYLTGFPTVTRETPPSIIEAAVEEDSDQEEDQVFLEPGRVLSGPPGTRWNILDYGRAAGAITGMVGEVKQLIQTAMMPSIMQGIPPGSRTAGYAIQELAAAAKAKWNTTVRNAEKAQAAAMNFCLWLIEHKVRQPLYLLTDLTDDKTGKPYRGYITLGPDDIKGYYAVEVRIEPRNPVDRVQEGTFMANMKAAGAATTREVIEARGHKQPDEVADEMLIEEELRSPEIRAYMRQMALKKAGLGGMMEDIQAAQAMFQQQQAMLNFASRTGLVPGGTNGNAAGVQSPGASAARSPGAPGMEVPGMPALPGMGMAQQNPMGAQGQLPRQYRPKGMPQNQPARPGIEGFRSR